MATPYRADHVGSLLRPQEVLDTHAQYGRGQVSEQRLREVEDAAILRALELQQEVGLEIFSDGEYRRTGWAGEFSASVDGYVPAEPPITLNWRMPDGGQREASQDVLAAIQQAVPQQAGGVIGARLQQRRRLTGTESAFLRVNAPGPYKITMPSPSYIVARGWKPGITDKVYSTRRDLLDDVARIMRDEVQALVSEGVTYIQIDNPHFPDYIPADRREQWRAIGVDPDVALDEDILADNVVLDAIPRNGTVVATHICRGNGRSAWHTQGGYEPIAEKVFGSVHADRWLLEYDSDRAGGFEPLRFMPQGKTVVLGLVTTKVGDLESQEDVRRRIEEATRYVPLENLALSPQCGFASVDQGNILTWDDQRRKLELVVDTARKVWG